MVLGKLAAEYLKDSKPILEALLTHSSIGSVKITFMPMSLKQLENWPVNPPMTVALLSIVGISSLRKQAIICLLSKIVSGCW